MSGTLDRALQSSKHSAFRPKRSYVAIIADCGGFKSALDSNGRQLLAFTPESPRTRPTRRPRTTANEPAFALSHYPEKSVKCPNSHFANAA
jgi:hypothetical protein